jgi:hypothetical protein
MPRKIDARKILAKQKAFHREWLQKPGTIEMKASADRYIEEDMRNDSPSSLLNISDSLMRLATWHGACGQVALVDGAATGWNEIHRSWLYQSLALRVRISVFEKGRVLGQFRPVRSLEAEASPSALCLGYALAVHREFETGFFGDAVRAMLLDKEVVRETYWEHHSVAPFLVQLLAISRAEKLDVAREWNRELGVYQSVIDAWNDPLLLEKSLETVCDFHCQRIEDTSGRFTAEFRGPPFDLVPAEVLAIYSVRRALGLNTPNVEHPLLEPPFNVPAGSPSETEDELLDRIEARI